MAKEYRIFEDRLVSAALKKCETAGYTALFMPQLIDKRMSTADPSDDIWTDRRQFSASVCATGKTRQGSKVVVFAHVPNYFSKSNNIKKAEKQGLVNNAGRMPQKDFLELVDQDGLTDSTGNQLVFVVDYTILRAVAEHPDYFVGYRKLITSFFGSNPSKIDAYVAKHRDQGYGNACFLPNYDDFNEDSALARLLIMDFCGFDSGLDSAKDFFRVSFARFHGQLNRTVRIPDKSIVHSGLEERL